MARVVAGKLYHLAFQEYFYQAPFFGRYRSKGKDRTAAITVLFESDHSDFIQKALIMTKSADTHIVLSVDKEGVRELFNGPTDILRNQPDEFISAIRRATRSIEVNEQKWDRVQIRSDEDVLNAYLGDESENQKPQTAADDNGFRGERQVDGGGARRNGGGSGGEGGGGGGDGDGEGPNDNNRGRGGASELLHHPVLFSIEAETFDDILGLT